VTLNSRRSVPEARAASIGTPNRTACAASIRLRALALSTEMAGIRFGTSERHSRSALLLPSSRRGIGRETMRRMGQLKDVESRVDEMMLPHNLKIEER
jgi:hypothetical protein